MGLVGNNIRFSSSGCHQFPTSPCRENGHDRGFPQSANRARHLGITYAHAGIDAYGDGIMSDRTLPRRCG